MEIGVIAELLRKPLLEDIDFAASIGVTGVQLRAHHAEGEIQLTNCTDAELAELKARCDQNKLAITAVCTDLGGCPFQVEKECLPRVELTKRIIDSTVKLGCKVITTHIGCVPDDRRDPVYPLMTLAVRDIADYAAARGVTMAIETGPEKADVLKAFIEDVGSSGLGVNFDPANLRMVSCEDVVYAVETLAPYIVHTHAKDGINLYPGSAAKAYGMRNPDGTMRELTSRAATYKEVPLGQGQVPWDEYLAALKKIGYTGFLTIERECGDDPVADIKMAVQFLKEKLA